MDVSALCRSIRTFDECIEDLARCNGLTSDHQIAWLRTVNAFWTGMGSSDRYAMAMAATRVFTGGTAPLIDDDYKAERIHERFDEAWSLVGHCITPTAKRRLLAAIAEQGGEVEFADRFVGKVDRRKLVPSSRASFDRPGVVLPFKGGSVR